jgi:SAM-dependent methyltransferase
MIILSKTFSLPVSMKDNFSKQSGTYARFRPGYPATLFSFLLPLVKEKNCAWDVGTGNGQIASVLADTFQQVYATDISVNQVSNAIKRDNIIYRIEEAGHSSFGERQFDLIAVAQAIHWFNFELFFNDVKRTLKPGGIIALIGYDLVRINPQIDVIVDTFYKETVGSYWDAERRFVEMQYRNIPFPFKEVATPEFSNYYEWRLADLIGYLNTWSAVQHYVNTNHSNPVDLLSDQVIEAWGHDQFRTVNFPVFMRTGVKEGQL